MRENMHWRPLLRGSAASLIIRFPARVSFVALSPPFATMLHPILSAAHQGATRIIIGLDIGLTFSECTQLQQASLL